jgi:hypothetical protein
MSRQAGKELDRMMPRWRASGTDLGQNLFVRVIAINKCSTRLSECRVTTM